MTRLEIHAALTDQQAVVCTLLGESANQPIEGIVAVACVIRNRATHPRWWGHSYRGVCLREHQFSCWFEDNANTERVYAAAEALIARQPQGERSLLSELQWVAAGVMSEQLRDVTSSADHYLTAKLFHSKASPDWAKGRKPVAEIGSHIFFRLEL